MTPDPSYPRLLLSALSDAHLHRIAYSDPDPDVVRLARLILDAREAFVREAEHGR